MNNIAKAVRLERNSKKYAENYYLEEENTQKHFKLDTRILDKLLAKRGKILDATMGRGRHVIHFAKKGIGVYGNDYNKHMVELVKNELEKLKLSAKLYNYDIKRLKFKNDFFDCVICMYSSLGCMPGRDNRKKAMREMARVLKPNGLLVVHAHNFWSSIFNFELPLWGIKSLLFNRQLEKGDYVFEHSDSLSTTYIHWFQPIEFRKLFEGSGLKIVREFYLNKDQDGIYKGIMKNYRSGGFIFAGRK